ncbi:hypothetical protein WJX72_007562 [[Myrmecia] bisecta]|uniref:Protein tweety homolog n=1 Tax=[Myrmecia] bisecta TaxID=41462 RepID=A0AAW1PQA1_9CHLO
MSQAVVEVPGCALVKANSFSAQAAASYDVRQWSYYKGYRSTVLPGVIVGGVCLLVGLLYVLWLCSLCCRARSWSDRKRRERHTAGETASRKRRTCSWVTNALVLLLALGVVGVSAWGMYESIKTTDGKVDVFWGVVASGRGKVTNISDTTSRIVNELAQLQTTVIAVSAALPGVAQQIPGLNGTAIDVTSLQATLTQAGDKLQRYVDDGRSAVNAINTDGVQAMHNLEVDYKHQSERAESLWRYVVLSVLFGLLVIFSALAGVLAIIGRTPRLTAAFLCLLWICSGLILILGAGGINGAYRLSNDTCLYVESFTLKVAAEKTNADPRVQQGLQYYFGAIQVPDNEVAKQIYGLDTEEMQKAVSQPEAQLLLTFLGSKEGAAIVDQFLNVTADQKRSITQFPNTLLALNTDIAELEQEILVEQFSGLHTTTKQLICCDMANLFRKLWIAWTVAGSLAALLAILVTGKVIASVGPKRRSQLYSPSRDVHPAGAVTSHGYPLKSAV